MTTRSWIRRLFSQPARTAAPARPRCHPQLSALEDRTVPATLTEAGATLTINLNTNDEQLSIVSNGSSYGLSSNFGFVDGGITAGRVTGFGSTSATVTAAGLAAYDTINIIDSVQNTEVRFQNSGTNAYSDNITVTLDDDTSSAPGDSGVTFAGSSSFGDNNITVTTTRSIGLVQGSPVLTTANGSISLSANAAGTATATPVNGYAGIELSGGATIQSTGSGTISLTGHGYSGGTLDQVFGVYLHQGSKVLGGTGTVSVNGTGSTSNGSFSHGVFLFNGSQISSTGGNVSVTGHGGGDANGMGVAVTTGSSISAGGMGTVTVTGRGSDTTGSNNIGVRVADANSRITSSGGNVTVTGIGRGSGGISRGNFGVAVQLGGVITAGGAGTVSVTGTGASSFGSDNTGVLVDATGSSIGTGAGGGNVNITGFAGQGSGQFSVALRNGGAVATQTGTILIDGKYLLSGRIGDVQLNGPVTSAGANITIQAFRDIIGDASGDVSTGAGGGNITLTADQDAAGAANDAGTIQLAGDLTAGIGQVTLSITDTDGFLNGNVGSAGRLEKRGGGTLQLNGQANTPQITDIVGGTLLVNGKSLSVLVTGVESGATLGGTGSIAGDVLVRNGGTITGGTVGTVGTLTVGTLSFDGGTYQADLSGNTSDTIVTSGAVDLQAPAQGTFVLNVLGTGGTATGGTYTFIDNQGAGAIVDPPLTNALEGGTATVNGQTGVYTYVGGTGNDFTLTVSSGPTGTFTGTAASENFRLVRTATTIELYSVSTITVGAGGSINFTNPTLLRTFDATTTEFVDIDGGGGSDNLMVDYSGVAGLENVDVEFTGGGATTNSGLFVNGGTFGSQEYAYLNATDGAIGNYAGAAFANLRSIIFYEGLSPIVNNSVVTDIAFDLPTSGNVQASLGDDGTTGNTLSRFSSNPTAFERTDFRNPTGSLTVNRGSATDDLTVNALPDFNAALTIGNALNPFDQLTVTGAVTLAADKNLGAVANTINFNGASSDVALAGNGIAVLVAEQSIALAAGSSLKTVDGKISLIANAFQTATGSFSGIVVSGATVEATGTGGVGLIGIGGDTGANQHGVVITGGGKVLSNSGTVTVGGGGGASTGNGNVGVLIASPGSQIHSTSGSVVVTGEGGGTGASTQNTGVNVSDGNISTDGSGTINVTGTGGTGSNSRGILLASSGQIVANGSGSVTVNGTGGSSGNVNDGVELTTGGKIRTAGAGTVDVTGIGGAGLSSRGVVLLSGSGITSGGGDVSVSGQGGGGGTTGLGAGVAVSANTGIATTISAGGGGSVTVTGTGGGGAGTDNTGVIVSGSGGSITAGSGGVSITGTAGEGTGQFAVSLQSGGAVTTTTGTILINGLKSAGGLSGDVQLNGPVTTAGGNIGIRADRDIIGDASGDVSTGAGGGNIVLIADQDDAGPSNDSGTIQLAGDLTAGTGGVALVLHDNDGFLNGNIVSASSVVKGGEGTLQVNGLANTYSGTTEVQEGTLLVNGNITGAGLVTVKSGATLGGVGTIAGTVGVLGGGTITGGTVGGVGTLTVGSLGFAGGTYRADVKNTTSDTIVVTSGNVNLQSGGIQGIFALNYTGTNTPAGTVFTFIDNRGTTAIANPPLANAPQGGTVPIKARVGRYTYTGGTGNDFTLTVQQTADLQVTKTGPASPVPGTDVSYTITITNAGPDDAANPGVVDALPAGTTFVSLTQNSGPAFTPFTPAVGSGGNVVLTAPVLASGATATFTLVVSTAPSATSTLSNTVQVATTTADSDPSNNTSTATGTFLPQADLQAIKTGPATVLSGQDLTYTITLTNAGASDSVNVFAADTLPANTTFVSLTQNSGPAFTPNTPTVGSGGNVTLQAATLAAGASSTFTLVVNVGATFSGTLSNTVQITSMSTADPDTTNNRSSVSTAALLPDDLQIHKSGPAKVDPGATLTYTLLVANTGTAAASTLVVADAIPTGTTFVSLTQTSGTAFDNITTPAVGSSGNVVLDTATFAGGAVATFTLVVLADAGLTGGTISNTAQVTSTTPDIDPSNNSSTVTTAITQSDVTVTKNGPATVIAGQTLTYTITFSNGGPDAATNTSITDTLPAGVTFVSLTQNAGGSGFTTTTPAVGSGGTVTISAASLAAGQVATYTLVVRVPSNFASGSLSNTANATSLTPDTDPSNNTAAVSTTVTTQADLEVTKTGPASVVPGQNATYTITFANPGPSDAQTVSITDSLPAGTTFVSLTQNAGGSGFTTTTPTVGSGGTVTISTPSLAVGQVATFTLVVRVDPALTAPDVTNSVTVTSATTDPNLGDNTSTDVITLTPQADVQVTLTSPPTVTAGQNLTYTFTVTNAGPSDAQTVSLGGTLPAGVTFVSLTQGSGPAFVLTTPAVGSGGTVSIDASTLAAGASATFTLVVAVDPLASGTLTNTSVLSTSTTDTTPGNNSATATTAVDALGDLTVAVTADKAAAFPGDVVTYTVVVTNLGQGGVTGATVSVPFAADLGSVAWTAAFAGGATGTASGTGDISQLLDLPAGASVTYTVTAVVLAGRRATLATAAQVTPGAKADPDLSNNAATASVVRAPEVEVVGAGAGGGAHVKVFATLDGRLLHSFFAYPGFAGGVTVAQGDVNGDGVNDIVTGAGAGGAPHVKVFDGLTGAEIASFFAYDSSFRDGVNVAAGDVDGDGRADVVTGAGPGGAPHVKVFSGPGLAETASFLAYREVFAGGVYVAVGDINGDGVPDLVTGAGPTGGPRVRAFAADGGAESLSFFDTSVGFAGGVRVAVSDYDGDGVDDLLVGTGPGGASLAKRYKGSPTISGGVADVVEAFAPFDTAFLGGVFVG